MLDPLTEQIHKRVSKIITLPVKSIEIHFHKIATFSEKNNLGFDEEDLLFYKTYFEDILCRSPTDVELFDLAQSNSEHSRHWFFNGNLLKDGEKISESLFEMVKSTLNDRTNDNSLVAFRDNSSVIEGYEVDILVPHDPFNESQAEIRKVVYDIAFTAETHNFPTGIAPFPGAATGVGGRIRDNQAVGIGGLPIASIEGD